MSIVATQRDELAEALHRCKPHFISALAFSLAMNVLYLAAPIYMLQVYDRVVPSGSVLTLVMLSVGLVIAFAALAGLDIARSRVLARTAVKLNRLLIARVFVTLFERVLRSGSTRSEMLRDFDTWRNGITGTGINAILDLPWAPIYIVVIFFLHPLLGAFALLSAILLISLAVLNERLVRAPLAEANLANSRTYAFAELSLRNAEVVEAMGMMRGLFRRWGRDRLYALERQVTAADRASAMGGAIRMCRLSMQSLVLGLGAYLVIERSVSAGAMFAASLLLGRAVLPLEQIVASWRTLSSLRRSHHKLREALQSNPPKPAAIKLPRPKGCLSLENVGYIAPGQRRPILQGIDLRMQPGEVLGIIGPSGSGKSTLTRHLVGVLSPSVGSVRLDGAELSNWPKSSVGRHIGYLPQDIELFSDTVFENIRRFDDDDEDGDANVIAAARLAGVHEMILRLPNGYETHVGEGGSILSGGYRQRIALARAVYGGPSLVVLDEPCSNLDFEGDGALANCLRELKQRRTTVVVVSHRPNTLHVADRLLVVRNGCPEMLGPRAEVVARLTAARSENRAVSSDAA